jgi:hypothetical protein
VAISIGSRTIALACAVLLVLSASLMLFRGDRVTAASTVTSWSPPGSKPLSDARAAALVSPAPEVRPGNARANRYVPSPRQLASFRSARTDHGQTVRQFNPLTRYVTGRPVGLRSPSTDELIQWVSHKWGIPTNLIRGQMVVESHWRQGFKGDRQTVGAGWHRRYPRQARIPGGRDVYQSMGIAQVKWTPDHAVGAGTEPLRWRSTAFNLDYYAATVRHYYDGACKWCGPGYGAGQTWNSIAAWYSPEPWANERAQAYLGKLRHTLDNRAWARLGD